jgi:hypothetical protein
MASDYEKLAADFKENKDVLIAEGKNPLFFTRWMNRFCSLTDRLK